VRDRGELVYAPGHDSLAAGRAAPMTIGR
jgi:hypothetical protein